MLKRRLVTTGLVCLSVAPFHGPAARGQCVPSELQSLSAGLDAGAGFGAAIAAKGSWAVVGAPGESPLASKSGAVHVLRFDNGQPSSVGRLWRIHARLVPSDGEWGAQFGSAVAMDDQRILVGAPFDWEAAQYSGSVYIFRREANNSHDNLLDDVWTQECKLVLDSTERGVHFGTSVAISDGWALIGAPGDEVAGAAYLFRRDPSCSADEPCTWTKTQRIAHGTEYRSIGGAIGLGPAHLILGVPDYYDAGAAYVYRLETASQSWVLDAVLRPGGTTSFSYYGSAVALNGPWVAIGDSSHKKVYVYRNADSPTQPDGNQWIEVQQLNGGVADTGFGAELSFGQQLLVGVPSRNEAAPYSGAAFVFGANDHETSTKNDDSWSLLTKLTGSASTEWSEFGSTLAISEFGAIIGAPSRYADPRQPGQVYVFSSGGDCNANGVPDAVDIHNGSSPDVNHDGAPDDCIRDCNLNGVTDSCELTPQCSQVCADDCDVNFVPDECDIDVGESHDVLPKQGDGVPDQCQADCNANGKPDDRDIARGHSLDCAHDGVPDECESDCDENGSADSCDLLAAPTSDCNTNGRPDSCDVVSGTSIDVLPVGGDNIPDECQSDCNANGFLDGTEIEVLNTPDCDEDRTPDDCQAELRSLAPLVVTPGPESDLSRENPVALAVDGNVRLMGWRSWEAGLPYGVYNSDVFIVRSVDGGKTWSLPISVHPAALDVNSIDVIWDIVTDGRGRWIAVWISAVTPTGVLESDDDIYFATSDDAGETWTLPQVLNLGTYLEPFEDEWGVELATDSNGRWFAVWSDGPGGGEESYLARSIDNGDTWQHQLKLGGRMARDPSVATDGHGTWIVTWQTYQSFGDSDWDILRIKSPDDGATWSPPTPVNRDYASDVEHDSGPVVDSDGHGQWLIAWGRFQPWGGPNEARRSVWYARSGDDGTNWSMPASLQPPTSTGDDQGPIVRTDGFGRWMMAWNSTDSLGNTIGHDNDILFATSTDDGLTWSAPAPMMATATKDGSMWLNDFVTDRSGHWAIAFSMTDVEHEYEGSPDQDAAVAQWYLSASPDCNCTGIPDQLDIQLGHSFDCNGDEIPDECEPALVHDANHDCRIDLDDFQAFALCGQGPAESCDPQCHKRFDTDTDGDVDLADAARFLVAFGG